MSEQTKIYTKAEFEEWMSIATKYFSENFSIDDNGVVVSNGQFSVGTKGDPRESVFGGGDSTPVEIAFHATTANTTGLTIAGATDITDIVGSDAGSVTGFFGDTAVGSYILIGSDHPFGGTKLKWDTPAAITGDDVTVQYLRDTTPSWISAPYMVADADFKYDQKADVIGSCECAEQLFVGFDPDDLPTTWAKVTLNINGTDYTKYWGRFLVLNAIATDPTIAQIKLHSNCFEIESDGTSSYRGRARYARTLSFGMTNLVQNIAKNPLNEYAIYGSDLTAGYVNNKLNSGAEDGFALTQNIEEGLDTSIPLTLSISYYQMGTATGTVKFNFEVFQVDDGFVYDGSEIPQQYTVTDTIGSAANLVRRTVKVQFLVNKLTPVDAAMISIYRDGTTDTLTDNIAVTNVALTGYFWRP